MNRNTVDSHRKTFYPGLFLLGFVMVVVVAVILLRVRTPAAVTHPLTPVKKVVVLLVPGASLTDWQNRRDMPALDALANGDPSPSGDRGFVGVFPNRLSWRFGMEKLATLNPATPVDFVRTCTIVGGRTLGAALTGAGIAQKPLGTDPAARAFLQGIAPPAISPALVYDNADAEPAWRIRNAAAVDGFVTEPGRLAAAIRRETEKSGTAPLVVTATFDDLLRCDAYAPLTRPPAAAAQRRGALRRLDALAAQLTGTGTGALSSDTALVIITPVGSMSAAERGELLGPLMIWQRSALPAIPGFLLTSPSTRQTPGLLAPGDIAPTILYLIGASEKSAGGRPAVVLESAASSAHNGKYLASHVANWSAQAREIRFLVSLPWLLSALLLTAALLGKGKLRAACIIGASAAPLALILAAPVASPDPGREAIVYACTGLITLVASVASAMLMKGKGMEAAVALLRGVFIATATVIVADTLTGGTLLARSPLSYSPVAAARFYGIGNEISGVFLGASLLTVGALCPLPLGAALGGITVALISGIPIFGADAGGFLASLVGFEVLFVLLTVERAENKRRAWVRAGAGATFVTVLLLVLYIMGNGSQSSSTRTHVGEAVASTQRDGGRKALLPLIQRKAATGVRLLGTSPWSLLLITEVGLCVWVWRRRSRNAPVCQAIYQSAFIAAGALLLVNDSGVVAAAACLLFPTSGLLLSESTSAAPAADREMGSANG